MAHGEVFRVTFFVHGVSNVAPSTQSISIPTSTFARRLKRPASSTTMPSLCIVTRSLIAARRSWWVSKHFYTHVVWIAMRVWVWFGCSSVLHQSIARSCFRVDSVFSSASLLHRSLQSKHTFSTQAMGHGKRTDGGCVKPVKKHQTRHLHVSF